MGTRSEFVGNKKKECNAVGLGLRLRMQENPSSSNKRMMVLPHNYYFNYNESMLLSSSSSSRGFDGGGGTGSGSMFCNISNQVACMSDIYDVVGAAASGSGTNTSVPVSKSLNSPNSDSFFPFNSSGEMAASAVNVNVNVRVPFTAAQLQELEKQTLIYKYLTSSVPVPCELLFPITKNPSSVPPSQPNLVQGSMELGILSINNTDPEPWRCRRTDGKKWRCSRNVAPDQKYCERHSHKSRPRSRKPVELPAHHINNNNNQNNVGQSFHASNTINKSYVKSHFLNQNLASSIPSTGQQQQQRNVDWFMKGETMPVASNSNQEWLQMMQSKLESNRDSCKYGEHHRDHPINSNSYTNLGGDNLAFQAQWLHDAYSLLLSPKMVSHQAQTQVTRHFIDAWSVAGGNITNEDGIGSNCFVSPNEKLPLSSLTLSMCGGSETIERNENALINTLGSMGCSEGENVVTLRPHWMNHVSGMGSPPGGPLAEALCLGIASSAKSDSNAASPHGCSTSTTTSS